MKSWNLSGNEKKEKVSHPNSGSFGVRHLTAGLGFLVLASAYSMRVNLSVAIVAMVNSTAIPVNDSLSHSCPLPDNNSSDIDAYQIGEYDWDEKTQGFVLGAFYYGYACTNIFGGRAAEKWGFRIVIGMGLILTALMAVLSPVAASISSNFLSGLRILQGCTEGVLFPAINFMITSWFPIEERSKFSSIIYAGAHIGTVLTLTTSGLLCSSNILGGWPSAFYIYGCLGILISILWFLGVRNNPKEHPWISESEKQYIVKDCSSIKETNSFPWKPVLRSKAFWAIAVAHFGGNWGFYTLLTEIPSYLDKILHIDMKNNGTLSAMPYLFAWITSFIYSFIVGKLLSKKVTSVLFIRRLSMVLSGYGPMLCLLGMCFVNCHSVWAVIILAFSGGFIGFVYCGYMSSHADIAPRYAGTLMGLTNTIGTIPGFVSPALVGLFTNENQTTDAWRTVFMITSVVYAITTTFYLYAITTDVQSWNG